MITNLFLILYCIQSNELISIYISSGFEMIIKSLYYYTLFVLMLSTKTFAIKENRLNNIPLVQLQDYYFWMSTSPNCIHRLLKCNLSKHFC